MSICCLHFSVNFNIIMVSNVGVIEPLLEIISEPHRGIYRIADTWQAQKTKIITRNWIKT